MKSVRIRTENIIMTHSLENEPIVTMYLATNSGNSLREYFDSLGAVIICFSAIIENMSIKRYHGKCLDDWIDLHTEYVRLLVFLETFIPKDITFMSVVRDKKGDRLNGPGILDEKKYVNILEKCKAVSLKITKFFDSHLSEKLHWRICEGILLGTMTGFASTQLYGAKYSVIGLIAAGLYGSMCYSRTKKTKKWKNDLDEVNSKIKEHILFMETNMPNYLSKFKRIKELNGYYDIFHIFEPVISSLQSLLDIGQKSLYALK